MLHFHMRCYRFLRIMMAQPQLLLVALAGIIAAPLTMPLIMSIDIRQIHLYIGSFCQEYILSLFFTDGVALFSILFPMPDMVMAYVSDSLQIAVSLVLLCLVGIACYLYQVTLVDMCKDALNNIPSSIARSARHAWSKRYSIIFFVATLWIVLVLSWFIVLFLGTRIFGIAAFWETFPMIVSLIMLVTYCKLLFSSCVISNESLRMHSTFYRSTMLFWHHYSRIVVFLIWVAIIMLFLAKGTVYLFGEYAGYVFPIVYAPLYLYVALTITQTYIATLGTTRIFLAEETCIVSGR